MRHETVSIPVPTSVSAGAAVACRDLTDKVVQLVAAAKKAGRKFVLVRVEREGNTRFLALPAEAG